MAKAPEFKDKDKVRVSPTFRVCDEGIRLKKAGTGVGVAVGAGSRWTGGGDGAFLRLVNPTPIPKKITAIQTKRITFCLLEKLSKLMGKVMV